MTGSVRLLPPANARLDQPCVVRDVLDRVGDRWSLLVLAHLAETAQRFNALHRAIGDVSKQVLARTLRRLEEDGLVSRTVRHATPPQVEYALTAVGRSFLVPLKALLNWAGAHHQSIIVARASFAALHAAETSRATSDVVTRPARRRLSAADSAEGTAAALPAEPD